MNSERACVALVAVLLLVACERETRAQQGAIEQATGESAAARETIRGIAVRVAEAYERSKRAMEGIDQLMSQEHVPLEAALASAEAAFLLDAPSKAIAIMERVLREHPFQKMPGVQFPVIVVGNFWIGTFARHSGDASRAEAAYRDVLSALKTHPEIKGASVLAAISYLYLSEIETHVRARPENAIALLKSLAALSHPKDEQGNAVFRVYLQWGQFVSAVLEARDGSATTTLGPIQPPYGDWSFVPDLHSLLVGLGDPAELQRQSGTRSPTSFFRCSLEKVLESRASPIDMSIAQAVLGHEYERQKDLAMACKYYQGLFTSSSFFAPRGGIALAQCWKDDNKPDEGRRVLDELVRRFPKYKDMAKRIADDWLSKPQTKGTKD